MTTDKTNDPEWMKQSAQGRFDKASDRGLLELKAREQAREERIRKLSPEAQKRIKELREQREKEVAAKRESQEKLRERNRIAIRLELLNPQVKPPTEKKHNGPLPTWASREAPTVQSSKNEQLEEKVETELEARYSAQDEKIRNEYEETELEIIEWDERRAEMSQDELFQRNASEITRDRGGHER
jgi:hypothetical protein